MPVAHPLPPPLQLWQPKMSPNVPWSKRCRGREQKLPKLENYRLLIKLKKNSKWMGRGILLFFWSWCSNILYLIWPQTTFKRFCLLENKAFNIYLLLAKVQKCPRRFTVLPIPPPTTHTLPETCTLPSWTEENAHNYFISISYFIKYMEQADQVPTESKGILCLFTAT